MSAVGGLPKHLNTSAHKVYREWADRIGAAGHRPDLHFDGSAFDGLPYGETRCLACGLYLIFPGNPEHRTVLIPECPGESP